MAIQLVFFIFTTVISVTLAKTTIPAGCTSNGKTYHVGESFQPSPCEHCFCDPSGMPLCAIADCFGPVCVDAIHDPTKCCAVCPNGENCRAPDGTIVKKGDTYSPDPNTFCRCSESSFMFGSNVAICAHRAVDPMHVPVIHVDPMHTP